MVKKRKVNFSRKKEYSKSKIAGYFVLAIAVVAVLAAGITYFQNNGERNIQLSPQIINMVGVDTIVFPETCSIIDKQEIRDSWNSFFNWRYHISVLNDANPYRFPIPAEENCNHFATIKFIGGGPAQAACDATINLCPSGQTCVNNVCVPNCAGTGYFCVSPSWCFSPKVIDDNYACANSNRKCCVPSTTTPVCGDSVLDASEECDDGNLNNDDACSDNCRILATPNPICGDSVKNRWQEQCDGNALNGKDCRNYILGSQFTRGTLTCGSNCRFVTNGCTTTPTNCNNDGTCDGAGTENTITCPADCTAMRCCLSWDRCGLARNDVCDCFNKPWDSADCSTPPTDIITPIDFTGFENNYHCGNIALPCWVLGDEESISHSYDHCDNNNDITDYGNSAKLSVSVPADKSSIVRAFLPNDLNGINKLKLSFWAYPVNTANNAHLRVYCNNKLVSPLSIPGTGCSLSDTGQWCERGNYNIEPSDCYLNPRPSFSEVISIKIELATTVSAIKSVYLDCINIEGVSNAQASPPQFSASTGYDTILYKGWIDDETKEPRTKITAIKAKFTDNYATSLKNTPFIFFMAPSGVDLMSSYDFLAYAGNVELRVTRLEYGDSLFFGGIHAMQIHSAFSSIFDVHPEDYTFWNYTWALSDLNKVQRKSFFTYPTSSGAQIDGMISNEYDFAMLTYQEDDCTPEWVKKQTTTCTVDDSYTIYYEDANQCGHDLGLSSQVPANGTLNYTDCNNDGLIGKVSDIESDLDISLDTSGTIISLSDSDELLFKFAKPTSAIKLKDTLIEKQSSSDNFGYLLVYGFDGYDKTFYIDKKGTSNQLCIVDEQILSLDEISDYCNGTSEKLITCSTTTGDYPCAIETNKFVVSGLENSAVIQWVDLNEGCTPDCVGKVCGSNGCPGGTCGTCDAGEICDEVGVCAPCVPSCACASSTCIDDTCTNNCGTPCRGTKDCSNDDEPECKSNDDCLDKETCKEGACVPAEETNWLLWGILIGLGVVIIVVIILIINFVLNKPQSTIPKNISPPRPNPNNFPPR